MGRRQDGKVRASLFPRGGSEQRHPRWHRQEQEAPGPARDSGTPGGSEGLGCPGTQGKPGPEPLDPPSLKLPRFVTVCRNNKVLFGWHYLFSRSLFPAGRRRRRSPSSPLLSPGKQPRTPPAPGRCPPAPCSSPTPAGAGRTSATFLIYSTPLEHARDPNGAPGTACTGLRERSGGSRRGRWNSSGTRGSGAGRRRQSRGVTPPPRETLGHTPLLAARVGRHGHSPGPGSREKPGGPSLEAMLEK